MAGRSTLPCDPYLISAAGFMLDGVIIFFDIVKKGFVWAFPQGKAGAGKQLPVTHAIPRAADESRTSNGLSDSVPVSGLLHLPRCGEQLRGGY
jgi:hypothetical protein